MSIENQVKEILILTKGDPFLIENEITYIETKIKALYILHEIQKAENLILLVNKLRYGKLLLITNLN